MLSAADVDALPVLPRNQFRIDGDMDTTGPTAGWAFTRNGDDRIYGISGPAPGGQGFLCLTLPERLPFMGCEDRLWHLEGWRGAFPAQDNKEPQNVDVALPVLCMLVPAPARTALLQLHDDYARELDEALRSAVRFATDHLQELEDDDDLVRGARVLAGTARQYGLQTIVEVRERAAEERAGVLKLSLDGLPSRW